MKIILKINKNEGKSRNLITSRNKPWLWTKNECMYKVSSVESPPIWRAPAQRCLNCKPLFYCTFPYNNTHFPSICIMYLWKINYNLQYSSTHSSGLLRFSTHTPIDINGSVWVTIYTKVRQFNSLQETIKLNLGTILFLVVINMFLKVDSKHLTSSKLTLYINVMLYYHYAVYVSAWRA